MNLTHSQTNGSYIIDFSRHRLPPLFFGKLFNRDWYDESASFFLRWLSPLGILLHSSYSIFSHPALSNAVIWCPYRDTFNNPLNQKKASRPEQVSQVAMLSEWIRRSRALSCCLQLTSAPMLFLWQSRWSLTWDEHESPEHICNLPWASSACLYGCLLSTQPHQAASPSPSALEQRQGGDSTGNSSAWALSCFTTAKTSMCFQSAYLTNAGGGQRMRAHCNDTDLG